MKLSRRLFFLASFSCLAAIAALAVARVGVPSPAPLLLGSVAAGALAGAAGLVRRRAGWASLVLVPLGLYLLWRAQLTPPPFVHGLGAQLHFYFTQLHDGASDYMHEALPFDFRELPELRLLFSTAVYLATALAAVAALTLRRVVPAIAVLLVPLGFGLTIDQSPRVLWLPLAFLLAAGLVLMVSRSLSRGRWRPVDALAGVGTAVIASLLALSLLGTTSVAAGKPWQDWRTWGPVSTTSSTRLVFNWMENYPRLLDPQTDAEVMRVRSALPSYWRANALDAFTGTTWFSTGSFERRVPSAETGGGTVYTVPPVYPQAGGRVVTEVFSTSSIYTDYFFSGGWPRTLSVGADVPVFTGAAASLAVDRRLGPKLQYAVTAVVPQLRPDDLVDRGRVYPQDIVPYTALPFPHPADLGGGRAGQRWQREMKATRVDRQWRGLYKLDRHIIGRASDPYQIALLVEQYLRLHYGYTLDVPASKDTSPYAAFLFETREGYCQHFAGAMAVLLRFNGIPARVAVGFTPGRRVGSDTFVVSKSDAHAWVEAYFPQVGWVPFDPTPGRNIPGAGPSSTTLGFVDPYTAAGGAGAAALPRVAAPDRRNVQQDRTTGQLIGDAVPVDSGRGLWWLPWLAAIVAALVVWPLARVARRSARLRTGDARARLQAALALVVLELRDYGVEVSPSWTLEETAEVLRSTLGVDAAEVVDRVQAVLFGGREATEADAAAVVDLRRRLNRRLRERSGVRTRLAARYGLRPARAASR